MSRRFALQSKQIASKYAERRVGVLEHKSYTSVRVVNLIIFVLVIADVPMLQTPLSLGTKAGPRPRHVGDILQRKTNGISRGEPGSMALRLRHCCRCLRLEAVQDVPLMFCPLVVLRFLQCFAGCITVLAIFGHAIGVAVSIDVLCHQLLLLERRCGHLKLRRCRLRRLWRLVEACSP